MKLPSWGQTALSGKAGSKPVGLSLGFTPVLEPRQIRAVPASYAPTVAMPDPQATERGQGSNTCPYGYSSGSEPTELQWELLYNLFV